MEIYKDQKDQSNGFVCDTTPVYRNMYMSYLTSLERFKALSNLKDNSCLSSKVHNIVCVAAITDRSQDSNYVTEQGFLDFITIGSRLPEVQEDSYEYFVACAKCLAPVFASSETYLMRLSPEVFNQNFKNYAAWTCMPKALQHCFESLKLEGCTRILETLLLSSSVLERSLGNVFGLKGQQCPSLLKDLLATVELLDIFGKSVIQILRAVIGPAISLNVRNVAWHGFPGPGELSKRFSYFIIHLTISLGQILDASCITPQKISHRPPFPLPQVSRLQYANRDIRLFEQTTVLELLDQSSFIMPRMLPFWERCVELYYKERYDECMMLLLPQLEHGMRRVFAICNGCPERVLTAENNVFFTTFDEILDHQLPNGLPNRLRDFMGDQYLTLLLDMLMYPDGPRIRDHLSHGECELLVNLVEDDERFQSLKDQWKALANNALCVSLACCLLFLPDEQSSYFESKLSLNISDQSVFHPISLAYQELLECSDLIASWNQIEPPPEEEANISDLWRNDKKYGIDSRVLATAKYVIQRGNDFLDEEELMNFVAPFSYLPGMLSAKPLKFKTLYRYRKTESDTQEEYSDKEEHIVGCVRRILWQMKIVCQQVSSTASTRFQQWKAKSLRSRQRSTYIRMLNVIPHIAIGLRMNLLHIYVLMYKLSRNRSCSASEQNTDIKLLKFLLQYCENLTTFTSAEKNRWEEAYQLSEHILDRFSKQTNVQ